MTNVHLLDEPEAIAAGDPSRMAERLLALPQQARLGRALGDRVVSPDPRRKPAQVVIAGMGGSAIGATLIKGIADHTPGAVPVTVWRDYGMPAWVDAGTLVIAVSVSGGTVETRSAFRAAVRQGARVLAITGPGELARDAETAGVQALRVVHRGEPRSAMGFTFVAPFRALQRIGALPDVDGEFDRAVEGLEGLAAELRPEAPSKGNLAKQVAAGLVGRVPVVYGSRHLMGVATRWKTQFNENADSWAIAEDMPEASHNSVQGYRLPGAMRRIASVLVLDSQNLPAEIRLRLSMAAELMREEAVAHRLIDLGGAGMLADILRGCLLGDMVSYYLAVLGGRNPSETAALNRLKERTHAAARAAGLREPL